MTPEVTCTKLQQPESPLYPELYDPKRNVVVLHCTGACNSSKQSHPAHSSGAESSDLEVPTSHLPIFCMPLRRRKNLKRLVVAICPTNTYHSAVACSSTGYWRWVKCQYLQFVWLAYNCVDAFQEPLISMYGTLWLVHGRQV